MTLASDGYLNLDDILPSALNHDYVDNLINNHLKLSVQYILE